MKWMKSRCLPISLFTFPSVHFHFPLDVNVNEFKTKIVTSARFNLQSCFPHKLPISMHHVLFILLTLFRSLYNLFLRVYALHRMVLFEQIVSGERRRICPLDRDPLAIRTHLKEATPHSKEQGSTFVKSSTINFKNYEAENRNQSS